MDAELMAAQLNLRGQDGIVILPSSDLPQPLPTLLTAPWHWFVVRHGWIAAAGSEVCSSIAYECAERAANKIDSVGGVS